MVDISQSGALVGILVAFASILLWAWRVTSRITVAINAIDKLTEMHLDENSVFSTAKTNKLLHKSMSDQADIMRSIHESYKVLIRATEEMTYYIRFTAEQSSPKKIPPFMSKIPDPG